MRFRALVVLPLAFTLVGAATVRGPAAQDPQDARGVKVFGDDQEEASLDYGQRHALVIGIDDYQDPGFPDLEHAVRDAEGVAQVLIEKDAGQKTTLYLGGLVEV